MIGRQRALFGARFANLILFPKSGDLRKLACALAILSHLAPPSKSGRPRLVLGAPATRRGPPVAYNTSLQNLRNSQATQRVRRRVAGGICSLCRMAAMAPSASSSRARLCAVMRTSSARRSGR